MKPEIMNKEVALGFAAVDNGGRGYVSRLKEAIETGLVKGAFHIAYLGAEIADKVEHLKEKSQIRKAAARLTEFMGKDLYR